MLRLATLSDRLLPRLEFLYGARAGECLTALMKVCARYADLPRRLAQPLWSERDVVLISYADQIRAPGEHPLASLRTFLARVGLARLFNLLHVLPFYPATSDDGFSVVDYRQVDPACGNWEDIAALGRDFDLMFDLVLNHASSASDWFQRYLDDLEPYSHFFVEADPGDDIRQVVRPRTSPLLTPVETARGRRHVWTTFSADQVDLNYGEPWVLAEMLDVLLTYIRRGARIVRLDAVAFLWKQTGTTCVHLPQTHAVVQVLRDVVDALAPGTLLLTETNVPHAENARYWGDSDEAHLIYNFSLPPLLLDALLTGDGTYLQQWLAATPAPPPGATVLNFTASHDGIGVRPLEALVPSERVERLFDAVRARGGLISQRVDQDGRESPYELNITWFDALGAPVHPQDDDTSPRFMASQALMLALRGIPAVYFHSLFGTANDLEGVARTGRARSINRRKFDAAELPPLLRPPSRAGKVLPTYQRLVANRIRQPAFHPDSPQEMLDLRDGSVVAFLRGSQEIGQTLLVAVNLTNATRVVNLDAHGLACCGNDLISPSGDHVQRTRFALKPYQVMWLPVAGAAGSLPT